MSKIPLKTDCKANKDIQWKSALRKFENFRKAQKLSVETIFNLMNYRGSSNLPKKEFIDGLVNLIQIIKKSEAVSLADVIDERHVGMISIQNLIQFIDKQIELVCNDTEFILSTDHPIFTEYLINRDDFQFYLKSWSNVNGPPDTFIVEQIMYHSRDERSIGDLQTLLKWLRYYKILSHVRDNRLMDVGKSLRLFNCPASCEVVKQGEPGDAFYIVLEGQFNILVNDIVVMSIGSGSSFGEKALENDAPRAATVISIVPGKLMVLSSFDYKSMAAYAQAKINSNMADFLCSSCEIFKMFSYSKLISIARKMTKRSFQAGETILNQNDISTGLLVIESGSIKIKRDISLSDIASKSFYSNKPLNEKFQNTKLRSHIKISLAELGPGDIFGDDTCRNKTQNTYSAVSKTCSTIIFINIKDAQEYFKGKLLEKLLHVTDRFHKEDLDLLLDFQNQSTQKLMFKQIKDTTIKDILPYENRIKRFKELKTPKLKFARRLDTIERSASEIFLGSRLSNLDSCSNVTPLKLFANYSRYNSLPSLSKYSSSTSNTSTSSKV